MTDRLTLEPLPSTVRTLRDAEAAALDLRQPLPYTPDNCVTCRGRKWFLWRDTVTGDPAEYECSCVDQYILHRWLSHSGVTLNFQRMGWRDFDTLDDGVAKHAVDYLDRNEDWLHAGFGMMIYGPRGNGKTLLANLIVKGLIKRGVPCFATTFEAMVEAYAGGWRDPGQEQWFNRTVRNARVLFIDDVGREFRADRFADATLTEPEKHRKAMADNRPGSMKETLLESVVRYRVGSNLPTIITTNFTPEQIAQGYGGHTTSLLTEKVVEVEVRGTDQRRSIGKREAAYADAGMSRPVVLE